MLQFVINHNQGICYFNTTYKELWLNIISILNKWSYIFCNSFLKFVTQSEPYNLFWNNCYIVNVIYLPYTHTHVHIIYAIVLVCCQYISWRIWSWVISRRGQLAWLMSNAKCTLYCYNSNISKYIIMLYCICGWIWGVLSTQ